MQHNTISKEPPGEKAGLPTIPAEALALLAEIRRRARLLRGAFFATALVTGSGLWWGVQYPSQVERLLGATSLPGLGTSFHESELGTPAKLSAEIASPEATDADSEDVASLEEPGLANQDAKARHLKLLHDLIVKEARQKTSPPFRFLSGPNLYGSGPERVAVLNARGEPRQEFVAALARKFGIDGNSPDAIYRSARKLLDIASR